jgi:uncharacterized protein YjbI with pentapeptide repeats
VDFSSVPGGKLESVSFGESSLRFAVFTGLEIDNVSFAFSTIDFAKFDETNLTNISFEFAVAYGADFTNSTLSWGWFQESDFSYADFTNVSWESAVNFCGENWKWNPPILEGATFTTTIFVTNPSPAERRDIDICED